ncbi:MAG TPA: DNA-binding domain-containing protein [Verrucomicrobiae bacterium]
MKKPRPELKRQTQREFHELQRLMARAVMRPLSRGDGMQKRWVDGRPTRAVAESFIKPNDRLTSFERLEIYNRQYWFRIRDCFYEDYRGLRAILGDKKFERLADEYLARYPSQSYTLRNLGSRLVKFLQAEPQWTRPRTKLALDLARLEWAHIEAFDNEARPALKLEDLANVDAARIRLQLQPHLTLLKLENVVDDFLINLKKNSGLRSEASNAMEQTRHRKKTKLAHGLKRQTNFLAVHRYQDGIYYKPLESGQFLLLSALQNGATLEKAVVKLATLKISGNPGETVGKWFANWAALGWFCGLEK